MHWLMKIGLFVLVLYVVGALALYFLQRRMMFSPDPNYIPVDLIDVKGLEEVVLKTPQGFKLINWSVPAQSGKPTLLFFHGNGGNVAYRDEKFRQLSAHGYGVFMLGYRGFGGSDGSPSESAFLADSKLAYDHLISSGLKASDIVVYGESIGSSVAVQLAARVENAATILEAPMYSVLSIAQDRYPYIPVRPFLRDKFESNLFIKNINSPLLVIHGTDDRVIPLASGQRLFDEALQPKQFHKVTGGGHNNLYDHPIVDEIVRFLQIHHKSEGPLVESAN